VLSLTIRIVISFERISPFASNFSSVPTTDSDAGITTVFIASNTLLRVPSETEIAFRITWAAAAPYTENELVGASPYSAR